MMNIPFVKILFRKTSYHWLLKVIKKSIALILVTPKRKTNKDKRLFTRLKIKN